MRDLYAHWAHVYDFFHPDRGDEARFWDSLAGQSGCQVLDLMCGTAEVSLALARLGHRVVGIDRSRAMLAVGDERLRAAADYPARNLLLVQGDACDIPVAPATFAFILVGGSGSFNHLDPDQAAVALAEMFRVLSPGGKLGMELLNPFLLPEIDPERVFGPLRPLPPGVWAETDSTSRHDPAAGRFFIRQRVRHEIGGDHGQWEESFILHAWTLNQIRALLEGVGFTGVHFYGGYAQEPFDRWSSDLLVMASRPVR